MGPKVLTIAAAVAGIGLGLSSGAIASVSRPTLDRPQLDSPLYGPWMGIDQDSRSPMWVHLNPSGRIPRKRFVAAAAADPATKSLMVFGGLGPWIGRRGPFTPCTHHLCFNDVWVLRHADAVSATPRWKRVEPNDPSAGPSQRGYASAVYNPGSNRMIIFAGDPNVGYCNSVNDAWVLTGANGTGARAWTELSPAGPLPPQRSSHTAVFDPSTNSMIVFGGHYDYASQCGGYLNDVWVLMNADGTSGTPTWVQLSPGGSQQPAARASHSAVYDPTSNRMIVFGGGDQTGPFSDVWVLTDANGAVGSEAPTWIRLSPVGNPGPRGEHTAVYDANRNRMIVFGGITTSSGGSGCSSSLGYCNSTWVLSHANGLGGRPTWRLVNVGSALPPALANSTAAFYDQAGGRMTIFSGLLPPPGLGCRSIFLVKTPAPCARPDHPGQIFDPINDAYVLEGIR